jgi:hypothetical protein
MVDQTVMQGNVGRCTSLIMLLENEGKVVASLWRPQEAAGFRNSEAIARQKLWRFVTQR